MKKNNILSIDGGGTAGIVSATVLNRLEKKLNTNILSIFDEYTATSTGTIILSLLFTGYKTDEIIDLYLSLSKKVFKRNLFQNIKSLFGLFDELYDSKHFERLLQEKLGDIKCSDLPYKFKFLALNISNNTHKVFTNKDDIELWKVVRSCSSIPTVFEPFNINGEYYIDGGVIANNPSLYLNYLNNMDNTYILSLGNGYSNDTLKFTKRMGFLYWAKQLPFVMLKANRIKDTNISNNLLNIDRVNVDITGISSLSTKKENLLKLVSNTDDMLQETGVLNKINLK